MKWLFAVALSSLLCLPHVSAQQAPTRPAITGLAFARFYTGDAAASDRFYRETLGLQKVAGTPDTTYAVNASQWIEIEPLPDPALKSRMAAVGFTTRNAAQLVKYLQGRGVAIEHPLQGGMFSVRDPEGNQVWFVQQGANHRVAAMHALPTATAGRMIHAGYVVQDAAREDTFFHDILGFQPNWHGGRTPGKDDWVSLQVPDGSDWIEYMLHIPADASLRSVGVQDHISLGTAKMATVEARLKANHCEGENCTAAKVGLDGKVQLNMYDPDLTRVEFMEYAPVQTPCCSPIVGKIPSDVEEQ